MFFETAVAVLVPIMIFMAFLWACHVANKNYEIEELRQDVKDRDVTISQADQRLASLSLERRNSERVPLRTKCRCEHDAYQHDDNKCRNWLPILGECGCLANREQVMYDPEPIRKMTAL